MYLAKKLSRPTSLSQQNGVLVLLAAFLLIVINIAIMKLKSIHIKKIDDMFNSMSKTQELKGEFNSYQKCKKKQHVAQLRLLVLYVQNGIEEQWQRIPSIIAVFVAEASLVMLDSSHDNYSTISKFLMNSPCVNMRVCWFTILCSIICFFRIIF